jgi:hypothetical protein
MVEPLAPPAQAAAVEPIGAHLRLLGLVAVGEAAHHLAAVLLAVQAVFMAAAADQGTDQTERQDLAARASFELVTRHMQARLIIQFLSTLL